MKKLSNISLILKGMAMGIADVVPGVSGGTVALLLGIYEQFIKSLTEVTPKWLIMLIKLEFRKLWSQPAFRFLALLGIGIGSAILIGARVILYSLGHSPEVVWALFFGLVAASIIILINREKGKGAVSWLLFILGAGFAFWITRMTSLNLGDGSLSILISGALAICAMLLPGISGSYILLIIGKYQLILTSLKNPFSTQSMQVIAVFAIGALAGLLLGSRFLKWLLSKYHHQCLMVLIGFMLGAMPKLWPWKSDIDLSGYNLIVIAVMLSSFVGVLLLERMGKKHSL